MDAPRPHPRSRRTRWAAGLAGAAVAVPALLLAPAASADQGGRSVQIQDRCDPATFTAAGIACVGSGDVTLNEFIAALPDGGHHQWRFSRHDVGLDRGQSLQVRNTGGEVHTFTEVANFGKGIVDVLNTAVPNEPAATPLHGIAFVPVGGSQAERPAPGTHLYECMIHPWMRTTVTVR